jgi:hypothetical protein
MEEIKLEEQDLASLIVLRESFLESYFTNDQNKNRTDAIAMINSIEAISDEMSKRDREWEEYEQFKEGFDESRKKGIFLAIIFWGLIGTSLVFFMIGKVDYATFFLLANYVFGSLAEQMRLSSCLLTTFLDHLQNK